MAWRTARSTRSSHAARSWRAGRSRTSFWLSRRIREPSTEKKARDRGIRVPHLQYDTKPAAVAAAALAHAPLRDRARAGTGIPLADPGTPHGHAAGREVRLLPEL